MYLAKTLASIKNTLSRNANAKVYAEGRSRHRALAGYESASAALAALIPPTTLTIEERDVLCVAILAELRLTKHTLWQSLLLLAFEPMLARVRGRLGRPESEDLDQRVLLAFLETAHSLDIQSHAARMLRLGLERKVYGERQAERDSPEESEFVDDTYCADPFDVLALALGEEKAAAAEVVSILEAEGGEELRDLMLATRANDASIRAYVAKEFPEGERAAAYTRLARARRRAERRLRERANRPALGRRATAA